MILVNSGAFLSISSWFCELTELIFVMIPYIYSNGYPPNNAKDYGYVQVANRASCPIPRTQGNDSSWGSNPESSTLTMSHTMPKPCPTPQGDRFCCGLADDHCRYAQLCHCCAVLLSWSCSA